MLSEVQGPLGQLVISMAYVPSIEQIQNSLNLKALGMASSPLPQSSDSSQ